MARREEEEYWRYSDDEQRSQPGWIGGHNREVIPERVLTVAPVGVGARREMDLPIPVRCLTNTCGNTRLTFGDLPSVRAMTCTPP